MCIRDRVEYAALAESASSHPISKSLRKAYGREIDRSRITDVQEISGNGVIAKVDGMKVAAGNDKLMERLGVEYIPCLLYTSKPRQGDDPPAPHTLSAA